MTEVFIVIYCGTSVPENILEKIKLYENNELVLMPENEELSYRMWRFLPIDDDDVSVMICRDADSRISYREKKLVDIFMNSEFLVHSIRDNLNHHDFMAGMWGMKKNNRINMKNLCVSFKKTIGYHTDYGYNSDQDFLRTTIKDKFKDSILTHCSYYLNNFPIPPNENGYFIGMTFIYGDNNRLPLNHVFY